MPQLTRRDFMAGVGFPLAHAAHGFNGVLGVRDDALPGLPRLDGTLRVDAASLAAAADDRGHIIHHVPRAVLRPASTRDVVEIVRYANAHGLKVAMRGQGHSHYGHAQVERGIVIDSSGLRRVGTPNAQAIDAEPGATWGDVAVAAFGGGLTPPVLPDVMMLTVGGTLSVGGLGPTSHRFGAQVDHVDELDVVTGDGRVVTCSRSRERELFELTLAGMGQCGLIVRAKLRLVPAPERVLLQELRYDDLDAYVSDYARAARQRRFAHQYGRIDRDGGKWTYLFQVGAFEAARGGGLDATGLRFTLKSDPTRLDYRAYLDRLAAFVAAASRRPDWSNPRPSVTVFVPEAASRDFLRRILDTPDDTAGVWRFDVFAFNTRLFTRPLLRMPADEVALSLWLFRTAPAGDAAALARMQSTVDSLLDRMHTAGGTPYAPYFPGTPAKWRAALGPDTWRRLAGAKRRYDPKGVLTPGPRLLA